MKTIAFTFTFDLYRTDCQQKYQIKNYDENF